MTRHTKSNAIFNNPQFFATNSFLQAVYFVVFKNITEGFNMVSRKSTPFTAFLASEFISPKNRHIPFSILRKFANKSREFGYATFPLGVILASITFSAKFRIPITNLTSTLGACRITTFPIWMVFSFCKFVIARSTSRILFPRVSIRKFFLTIKALTLATSKVRIIFSYFINRLIDTSTFVIAELFSKIIPNGDSKRRIFPSFRPRNDIFALFAQRAIHIPNYTV